MIKEKKNRQLTDPKTRWGPYFNHILSNLFPYKVNIYLNSETEISQAARERNAGIRVKVKSMLLTQVFVFLMFRNWKKIKNLKLLLQMKDQYD